MPINMKITFLLLGTYGQRFASVTLFANVYLLFYNVWEYCNHYFNKLKNQSVFVHLQNDLETIEKKVI